jgi:hypothetical protein
MKSSDKNNSSNQYRKSKAQLEKELLKKNAELQKKKEELMKIKSEYQQAESAPELWEKFKLIEEELKKAKQEIEDLKEFKKQIVGFKNELEEKLALNVKPQEVLPETQQKVAAPIASPPTPSLMEAIAGELRLLDLKTIPVALQIPSTFIPYEQPFGVQLTLDLTNVKFDKDLPIDCKITVYAQKLGDGPKQVWGEVQKNYEFADRILVDAKARALSKGTHRIQVVADLSPRGKETEPHLISMASDLIQVA